MQNYLARYGELSADYFVYLAALNRAAQATGQHVSGRGSHGLKHNFAQARFRRCVDAGWSLQRALRQVSLECSHFRLKETWIRALISRAVNFIGGGSLLLFEAMG